MAATATTILSSGPAQAPAREWDHPRLLVFSVSLLLKTVAGLVFFGSVDVVNDGTNSLAILAGRAVHLPYLPAINAFLWFGGFLSAIAAIPLPLSFKIVPILFDSLLAVLIYDLLRRSEPRLALRAGLLYALSPLALLITSFHGQWDAIALFFLLLAFGLFQDDSRNPRKEFLFGVVFAVGLFMKPIGLAFLLLFPPGKRGWWSVSRPAILGLLTVWAVAMGVCSFYGYSTIYALLQIVAYSGYGVQVIGLPLSPLLSGFHLETFRLLWIVPAIILLAYLHRIRKLGSMDAMLLFYLYCIATMGISPQYLVWPLPFLIVTKRLRLAAIYTAVVMSFLLIYYASPWATYYVTENLGVFAPLASLGWLRSPAYLTKHELVPLIHAFGNLALPAFAMIATFVVAKSALAGKNDEIGAAGEWRWSRGNVLWYILPIFFVFATILATKLMAPPVEMLARLRQIWKIVPSDYGLRILSEYPKAAVARDAASSSPLNVVVLLALFTAIWCFYTANSRNRVRSMQ